MVVGSRPIPDLALAPPLRAIFWLGFPLADIESAAPISLARTSAVQRLEPLAILAA